MKNLLLSVLVSGLVLAPLSDAKSLRQSTKPVCATGRLIATFDEEGDIATRDVRYYRCLLKQHANGYQVQDFYWPSARRQSDPVVVTDKKKLKAWDNAALKFTGPFVSWHETGQRQKEGQYVDGQRIGKWSEWYKYGQKKLEGQFTVDKETGNWTLWYENGQKQAEGQFVDGNESGHWTRWYKNGQKEAEGQFVDGKENGRWTLWHENGQKQAEGQFINGEKSGRWTLWYDNGRKQAAAHYDDDGQVTGTWTFWYENGQKEAEGPFVNGEESGRWTLWYDNGQKQAVTYYDGDGQATGTWTLWHKNGRTQMKAVFQNGEAISRNSWDENGNEIEPSDVTSTFKSGSAAIARHNNTNDIPADCALYADKVMACSEQLSGGSEQLAESLTKHMDDLKRSWSLVSEQDQDQLRQMCIQAVEAFEPAAEQMGCQ